MQRTGLVHLAIVGSLVVGALGVGADAPSATASGDAAAEAGLSGDVIVRVEPGASPAAVARDAGRSGARVGAVYDHAVQGFAADLTPEMVARLLDDPRVATVEADHTIRAFETQTGIRRIGADEYAPAGIGTRAAVDVDIAILDTGTDGSHDDLHVVGGVDCRSGTCATVASPTDPNGHGTHVAGIAGARDDGSGVVGAAPGARLHSVRVLESDGSGSLSALLAGLEWLRINADRVEVANLSLGCACQSTSLNDAVRSVTEAGVTLVVAAGNAGVDAAGFSPANHPDTIAVGAMSDHDGRPGGHALIGCNSDADDTFASYSNHGAVIDLIAPGSCIVSTWPDGRYARSTGTSMAAPHVAGVAAVHIASAGVPRSASRPDAVREELVTVLSVPSTDACGYAGSRSTAPMLHLTCGSGAVNASPTLEVTEPADGTTVVSGTTVPLRATAQDAEDGALSDEIVWTSNLAGGLGTGPSLDVQLSEVGDHNVTASVTDSSGATVTRARLVRVTEADGSTGESTTDDPAIPQEPEPEEPPATTTEPQLTIVAPVPSARIVADRDVQLVSDASDREDGDITGWVTWRSDRDGPLGEGGTIGARLSAGTHRITATVADSDGQRIERAATIEVAAPTELGSRAITGACPPDRVPDGGFVDVGDADLHAAAIDCVAWWEVARGAADGSYQPGRTITRAQMATFLAQLIERTGGDLPETDVDHFDDDDGTTHEANIDRLAAAGVLRGTGERTYGPAGPVNRAQMATFLVAAYEHRSGRELPGIQERFSDVTGVHVTNIRAIAAAGITGGVQGDRYEPDRAVRRDQMASFVARLLDVLVAVDVTAPPSS